MAKVVAAVYAHNEEHFLPHTLKRLNEFKKEGLIDSVVVINDGSTDKTVAVAQKYGATLINHEKNLGKRACFVSAAQKAHELGAKTLFSLDADIEYFPHKTFTRMIEETTRGRTVMAVAQQYERHGDTTPVSLSDKVRLTSPFFYKYELHEPKVMLDKQQYYLVEYEHSRGIRAIRMDALKPLFAGNARWKRMLLTGPEKRTRLPIKWGLEFALGRLIPLEKTAYMVDPVFTAPAHRKFSTSLTDQQSSREVLKKMQELRDVRARRLKNINDHVERRRIAAKKRPL